MKQRTFLQSLNDAVEGFIYVVRHEQNMRVHFLVGFAVLLLAVLVGTSRVEWMMLCLVIALVLAAEMMNTVVEEMADAVFKGVRSPAVRTIKHISAGMVLVAAVSALVVGFFVFSRYLGFPFAFMALRIRYAPWHVTFFALLAVVFLVIARKAFSRRGSPFRGGPISGHSAAAFSLWTAILFTQPNAFVVSASFCIAALVAQSRLRAKIHSFGEVALGAVVGVLVTALCFQLFR